jgi:hypothetical protein
MHADRALFIAVGLALLLLFGCASNRGQPAPSQPAPPEKQPGGDIGDWEISSSEPAEIDDLLSGDEILIPPPEDLKEESETGNQSSGFKIDVSDVFVEEGSDFDYISEDDIIEPI